MLGSIFKILLVILFVVMPFLGKTQKLNQKIFDIKLPIYFDEYNRKLIIDKEEFKLLTQENSNLDIKILHDRFVYNKDSLNTTLKTQLSYYSLEYIVSFLFNLPNEEFKFNIIIALTENLDVLYFIDYKQNTIAKQFEQIKFDNKKSEYKIIKTSLKNTNYIIKILNPYYKKKKLQDNIMFIENNDKIHFKLGFSGGIGNGYTEMSYTPILPDSVFSIYYNADIKTAYSLKMHINTSYKKTNLSFILAYQKLYFETNTRAITSISSSKKIHTDYKPNGLWPSKLLYTTFSLSYDFYLKNHIFLSPSLSFSKYFYINANKHFDKTHTGTIENNFKNKYSYSFGLKLKYAINYKYSIFIEFSSTTNLLDASSYFNNINKNTYISRQVTNNFEFGFYYRIR